MPAQQKKRSGRADPWVESRVPLYLTMIAATIGGILMIFVAVDLEDTGAGPRVLLDLLRDIGIGLLVAVITAMTIELFVNARERREFAHDVFQATFRQFLPDPVYVQVRDSVVRSPVIRRNWRVELRVLDPNAHADMYASMRRSADDDLFLVDCVVSYAMENLRATGTQLPIEGGIDLDATLPAMGIPRFTSILVGSEDIEHDIEHDPAHALTDDDAVA
ncbi:MAG: hypothetical protein ABR498_04110, partial [Candidatus Dormibacteria bacterium]